MFKKFLKLEEILKENNKNKNESSSNNEQQEQCNREQQENSTQEQNESEQESTTQQSNNEEESGKPQEDNSQEQNESEQEGTEQQEESREQQSNNEEESGEPQEDNSQEQNESEQEGTEQQEESRNQEQNRNEEQGGEPQEDNSQEQNENEQEGTEKQEENTEQEQNRNEEQGGEPQEDNSQEQNESMQEDTEKQEESREQQSNNEEESGEPQADNSQEQNGSEQEGTEKQEENTEQEQNRNEEQGREPQENSSQEQNESRQENTEQQEESREQEQNSNEEQGEEPQKESSQEQNDSEKEGKQSPEDNSQEQSSSEKESTANEEKDNKQNEELEKKKREAEEMFNDISKESNPDHYNDVGNQIEELDESEIPDSVIKVLIDNFFSQHFCSKQDLNKKQDAYQEDIGDLKWNITDIIKHKVTKDLNKIKYDKYGFKKESGKGESIPLSFYFDLSGSMQEYIRTLSIMAYRMLKKDVKIIIGYNQNAYVQINKIPNNYTIDKFENLLSNLEEIIEEYELEKFYLEQASYYGKLATHKKIKFKNRKLDDKVEIKKLEGIEIDQYLIDKKAEKTVIFSDFDPKENIENLSQECKVWWFCFRERWGKGNLQKFKGEFYRTTGIIDIVQHLKNINKKSYELKQRKLGEFGTEEYFYGINGAPKNSNNNYRRSNYYDEYERDEWDGERW